MIDLETLQGMWEDDSKIDPDNLHTESLNIPVLHSKYYQIYNTLMLSSEEKQNNKERTFITKGMSTLWVKADPQVYVENPFPKKIRDKETMQKYLDR